jgi:hypothetical protein
MTDEWKDADRISNAMVDLMQAEVKNGVSPVSVLAGQLLSLMSLLSTMPRTDPPTSVLMVEKAVAVCLLDMKQGMAEGKPDAKKH